MGINLVLPFDIDGETEYVEMTLHPDRTITFPHYDIEHDEVLVELGEKSPVYDFYFKPWDSYSNLGIMKLAERDDWADALVGAVRKQGLGDFAKERYVKFFLKCMSKGSGSTFDPLEEIQKLLTEDEYIDFLKSCVRSEYAIDFDFEPADILVDIIGKDDFVNWLLDELISEIVKGDLVSKASNIASYVEDYTFSDDRDITEEWINFYEENEYTNTIGKRYCLHINDKEIACWNIVVESRIIDPIGFHADVEQWGSEYGPEYGVPDNVSSVLSELGMEEPELDDPEPPDHPEPDADGEYATIYLVKDVFHNAPYWAIVPYESDFDATEAAELSAIILGRDGEREAVDIYTAKKKNKPHERAEKQMRRELGEHNIITEDFNEGEEWDARWTKVYDVLEKIE